MIQLKPVMVNRSSGLFNPDSALPAIRQEICSGSSVSMDHFLKSNLLLIVLGGSLCPTQSSSLRDFSVPAPSVHSCIIVSLMLHTNLMCASNLVVTVWTASSSDSLFWRKGSVSNTLAVCTAVFLFIFCRKLELMWDIWSDLKAKRQTEDRWNPSAHQTVIRVDVWDWT